MGSGLLTPTHIVVLLLVVLLVFGARRLPELGRGLGSGMREFKDAVTGNGPRDDQRPAVTAASEPPPPASAPAQPSEVTREQPPATVRSD